MEIYQQNLYYALWHHINNDIITCLLFFIAIGLMIWLVKSKIFPKWSLWFLIIAFLIVLLILWGTVEVYLDIKNESYVVYHGKYTQISEGYSDVYQTTTLVDDGKKRLASHWSMTYSGEYYGYVVYSERSEYVVYVGQSLP